MQIVSLGLKYQNFFAEKKKKKKKKKNEKIFLKLSAEILLCIFNVQLIQLGYEKISHDVLWCVNTKVSYKMAIKIANGCQALVMLLSL